MPQKDYLDSILDLADSMEEEKKEKAHKKNREQGKKEKDEEQKKTPSKMEGVKLEGEKNKVKISSSYHPSLNEVHDLLKPSLDTKSFSVYHTFYRESYGWNRNWCQITFEEISQMCNISKSSVRRAVNKLVKKNYIKILEDGFGKPRCYRIFLPHEIEEFSKKTKVKSLKSASNIIVIEKKSGAGSNKDEKDTAENELENEDMSMDSMLKLLIQGEVVKFDPYTANELIKEVDEETLENWIEFLEDKQDEINNPAGFLRKAIEEKWIIPEDWEENHKKREEMEKQAEKEEERLAAERAQWEHWLKNISHDIKEQAKDYAEDKFDASKYTPDNEKIKKDMLDGFEREFLRKQFERERNR